MSVNKRTWTDATGKSRTAFRVRWREGDRWQSRTFARKADADDFDREVKRRDRLGLLADTIDRGGETLDAYVSGTFGPVYVTALAPKTQAVYAAVYDRHISPTLGATPLRAITSEQIARWQRDRLADGCGPAVIRKAGVLLGSILQRAAESGRISVNPSRVVRKAAVPRGAEVTPLAPATVERMRAGSSPRDATLIAVLAYAGLRPGEALGLRWADVRERTILVQRAVAMGELKPTKTGQTRTVRLVAPLAADLREWRMRSGRPTDSALVFPNAQGNVWSEAAWQSWRRKAFRRSLDTAGVARARPYDLRHSAASLWLHEGQSVIQVARWLGHGAGLTLSTYGHVIDELADAPRSDAETVILAAREGQTAHQLPMAANAPTAIG